MMGEQGAESLHADFNYTEGAYKNMTDRAERLKVVLQNHHLRILPTNESLQPPPLKQRKKKLWTLNGNATDPTLYTELTYTKHMN